jgi:succinyl-CoA synthetase beta subunit
MDEMAEGIVRYVSNNALKIPLVVRLCGTLEDEGKRIMRNANLPVYDDLEEAVEAAVKG